ncbi:DUF6414 family protein [Corynebacterium callunae]|uniref:Uncharacterized protein n=1 Tax=Corynebacterium callunae DSM 20147 TaxID=1121353 RepID=M1UXE2_9CORY|nr:hypothetical protein [Corynebacterium callunae]AGG65878.1 hypothetical protein H924_02120 [Corynebacterium callunae DSM 20147]
MTEKEIIDLPDSLTPTVVVYQNADFVSGLLQEIYQVGILEATETDIASTASKSSESSNKADASGEGRFNLPFFSKANLKVAGEYARAQAENDGSMASDRRKFVYSQAYYMDRVRNALRASEQVRTVTSLMDAESIRVGEFIEFEATFTANEANAILDILTPELTFAITSYLHKAEGIREIQEISDDLEKNKGEISVDKIYKIRAIYDAKAQDQAELAAAVTAAIRTDFRSDKTKEFYATIGQGNEAFTAVTICDAEHFVSIDSDRLLDGRFTVLAKVIADASQDVPVLAKNKLLHRLDIKSIKESLSSFATDVDAQDYVNLDFKTQIEGTSISVLPVAIYI